MLQVSVFPHLAWRGVVPDLVLLVVVRVGLRVGSEFAMVLGFGGGLLLDLAPPADHVVGRWALALVVVGLVAGRMPDARVRPPESVHRGPRARRWPARSSAPRSSR